MPNLTLFSSRIVINFLPVHASDPRRNPRLVAFFIFLRVMAATLRTITSFYKLQDITRLLNEVTRCKQIIILKQHFRITTFVTPFTAFSLFNMGDFSEWEIIEMAELKKEIEESGVSNIEEFFKKRLEKWREVEVNIAITGDSGSGKSSFINAIRE